MGVVYNLMERLRQVVGSCWDYCVIWKLSEDPWLLECVDWCCGGTYRNCTEEELAVSCPPIPACKDVLFPHPTMRSCELLSQLPPSLPLEGINAEVLISNQPRWLKNAKISHLSTPAEEIMESKVLIPVPGGLVEFYASKMVPEDQSLIDFVVSQCSALSVSEQAAGNNQTAAELPPYSPSTALADLNLSSCAEATADRIRICNSAMNFLQQFTYLTETRSHAHRDGDLLLEDPHPFQSHPNAQNNDSPLIMGEEEEEELQDKGGAMKHEMGRRPDSGSDSDPIDDEEDSKYTRRKNGKGNQSKNLVAERKRRKKLNERLYMLRSLVPKISKVQVEVAPLDGNEFFIKVFGEQKRGGFVRLMEALDSLGLEITTVNVTSCISLVSYVFTVEKKDSGIVQADFLRDTLLEMTRNQSVAGEWTPARGPLEQYQQQQYFPHPFHQFQ